MLASSLYDLQRKLEATIDSYYVIENWLFGTYILFKNEPYVLGSKAYRLLLFPVANASANSWRFTFVAVMCVCLFYGFVE